MPIEKTYQMYIPSFDMHGNKILVAVIFHQLASSISFKSLNCSEKVGVNSINQPYQKRKFYFFNICDRSSPQG